MNFLVMVHWQLFSSASSSCAAENFDDFEWDLNSAMVGFAQGVHVLLFFSCCVAEDLVELLCSSSDMAERKT